MSGRINFKDLICECGGNGLNVVRLRRLFTLLMEDHFSNPENMIDYTDELKCLSYNPDAPGNSLVIGPAHTDKITGQDADEGVFISIKQMLLHKLSMGDHVVTLPDFSGKVLVKKGSAHVVISHKHTDADVSMIMAESSLTYLTALKEPILKTIPGLLSLDCVEVAEVRLDRENPQARYRCDLSVKVEYQLLITLFEESHRLKKFGFQVDVV